MRSGHKDHDSEVLPSTTQDDARANHAMGVHPFTCVIVGSGTLAIHCAQQLREAGHGLRAVLPTDAVLDGWAAREDVPRAACIEELDALLDGEPVDWLFSIVNSIVLPSGLLGSVRRGAFNYHDGPLPRYAGTHATTWALIARETDYAITWHRIAGTVNANGIVVQRAVDIVPIDTVLSLNLKCYQAAGEAFAELLATLTDGTPR